MDYCIPLKDPNIIEIIRGSVLWSLWLDRNIIIFQGGQVQAVHVLGSKILTIARFWALNQKIDLSCKLNLIFPCDLKELIGSTVTISMGAPRGSTPMLGIESSSNGDDASFCDDSDGCCSSLHSAAIS